MINGRLLVILSICIGLAACSTPIRKGPDTSPSPISTTSSPNNAGAGAGASKGATAILPKANSGRGGYYKDDGPGEIIPEGLENTVDPIPKIEPLASGPNKPYRVFGKNYTPITDLNMPFVQTGVATWYGKKFHGSKTSSGEIYDMYKMTAAHTTLPIPSYARVTNLSNGRQIIVRINDRGPFHANRVIDLSYTAALKLDILNKGSSNIQVERLLPAEIEQMAENRQNQGPSEINTSIAQSSPSASTNNVAANNAYYLQFGAFALKSNAELLLGKLKSSMSDRFPPLVIVPDGNLFRLQSGPFTAKDDALQARKESVERGLPQSVIVQRSSLR